MEFDLRRSPGQLTSRVPETGPRSGLRAKANGRQRAGQRRNFSKLAPPESHPDLRLALPALPENVAIVRHALGGLVEAVDGAEGVDADVKLAVTEACANVVVHAYDDGGGAMEVTAGIDGRTLEVAVRDEGRGMAPRIEGGAGGQGLGLPLIATLSRGLKLNSRPEGGTDVRMSFSLDRSESVQAAESA